MKPSLKNGPWFLLCPLLKRDLFFCFIHRYTDTECFLKDSVVPVHFQFRVESIWCLGGADHYWCSVCFWSACPRCRENEFVFVAGIHLLLWSYSDIFKSFYLAVECRMLQKWKEEKKLKRKKKKFVQSMSLLRWICVGEESHRAEIRSFL